MTTVTTRLAIDVLRSARVRREAYVGEWLPEPLVEAEAPAAVESEESVSLAMLVLLERLSPVERAVFVLRESFDLDFARSRRSSTAPRPTAARSSSAPAAASTRSARASTPTRASAAPWPRASSPPPARATSTASSPCSRRTPS